MKIQLFLCGCACLLMSCTHTENIVPAEGQWDEVNRRASERRAVVSVANGDRVPADNVQLTPDSTSWMDPETGAVRSVATADIADIRFTYRGRGALEGLGLGFLSGGLFGAGAGLASGDDPSGWISFTAEEKALLGAVVFGGVGGLVGLSIGAAVESTTVYRLSGAPNGQEP